MKTKQMFAAVHVLLWVVLLFNWAAQELMFMAAVVFILVFLLNALSIFNLKTT